jgi:hypothetical protein
VCFENVIQYVNNTGPRPDLFLYAYPLTNLRVDALSTGEAFQYPRPSFVPGVTPPPTFFGVVSMAQLTWINVTYDNTYFIIDNFAVTASAGVVTSCPLPVCSSPTISALGTNISPTDML